MAKKEIAILQHNEEVADKVLEKLGKPQGLSGVRANLVWENWYRVNVRVVKEKKEMLQVTSISDSFLVKFKDGNLCGGDEIQKKYE
jgi:hypothetical protein